MNINIRIVVLAGVLFFLCLPRHSYADTEFFILQEGNIDLQKCDFLKIDGEHISCTVNSISTVYNLDSIKLIKIIFQEKTYNIENITKDDYVKLSKAIHSVNQLKNKDDIAIKKAKEAEQRKNKTAKKEKETEESLTKVQLGLKWFEFCRESCGHYTNNYYDKCYRECAQQYKF